MNYWRAERNFAQGRPDSATISNHIGKVMRKAIDSDQLALKLHHLEKLQNEVRGIQVQLDKMGQADDTKPRPKHGGRGISGLPSARTS